MKRAPKKPYNTAAKSMVLSFFKANRDQHFTTEQVIKALRGTAGANAPGSSTIYRVISRICDEGLIRRFSDEENANYLYQYMGNDSDCAEHFHLKCLNCGTLAHLECDMSKELMLHIFGEHGFKIDSGRSILYGKCAKCADKEA